MRLVIASNNKHKIMEIKSILGEYFDPIISMSEAGFDEDIVEDGVTFDENAMIKARYMLKRLKCPIVADDSGLEVYALDNAPGVYSARYAGKHGDDEANNDKLIKEMKNTDDGKRGAQFVSVIALLRPDKVELVSRGTCAGEILRQRVGEYGFGYDPLFYMPAYDKTMAQMTMDEKNKISHRRNALQGIKSLLDSEV